MVEVVKKEPNEKKLPPKKFRQCKRCNGTWTHFDYPKGRAHLMDVCASCAAREHAIEVRHGAAG